MDTAPESSSPGSAPAAPRGVRVRVKRVALAATMAVVTLNAWTGSPLLALWVGSRVQGSGPPKMASIAVVAVVLGVLSFALVKLLRRLGAMYDQLTGQSATVTQHTPWLRSMRGERERYPGMRPHLTMLERILVVMVLVVFAAFEIWFFFYSTSPIDQRSGRGALPNLKM